MKRWFVIAALLVLSLAAVGQSKPTSQWQALSILRNARYLYVTSYDGPEFSRQPLPEDRTAMAAVQSALQQSGHFVVVYTPRQADIVVVVTSRPSEDVMDVYAPQEFPSGHYLWRGSAQGGLTSASAPLVQQFEADFARATGQQPK